MHAFNFYARFKYKGKTYNEIFVQIHDQNAWQGDASLSGQGSDLTQTAELRAALPGIFSQLEIKSFLDIPCGDHFWMNLVPMDDLRYTGGDLVEGLIHFCEENYAAENKHFQKMDLVKVPLGQHDMIFVRDCLVHLSFAHIHEAIQNIKASGSAYLMATTFPEKKKNFDVHDGGWRYLNLQLPPFNFPEPVLLINEKCTEGKKFADKSMGIWRIDALPSTTN